MDYEYQFNENLSKQDSTNTVPNVKGRLKEHVSFWIETIKVPEFIVDCIREGYKIPFYTTPEPATFANNVSALSHGKFVSGSVSELLLTGWIVPTQKQNLAVVNSLSVAVQPSGKKRLILDLRYVMKHIYKQKIKFKDWKTAIIFFGPGSYFTKFDPKSGYHHIDICSHHQLYLGFSWSAENQPPQFYMFTVLPFGLSSAPYIFTKLIRPLIRHWRDLGINATIFLNDNLDIENSPNLSLEHSNKIKSDFNSSGFVSNGEKSRQESQTRQRTNQSAKLGAERQ